MIRVSVLYPNTPHMRFDHQYYVERHRALILDRLAPFGIRGVEIDRGVGDGAGGSPPFVGAAHLTFDSADAFQRGWAAVGGELVADIKNYTDAMPVLQVSEVTAPAMQPYMPSAHDQREREPLH